MDSTLTATVNTSLSSYNDFESLERAPLPLRHSAG